MTNRTASWLIACASSILLAHNVAHAAPWTTDVDAPPPLVDPLVVENKCIGDPDWPTMAAMAGRDVFIKFPTDRDCVLPKPGANNDIGAFFIGGTLTNPARNIHLIGGKYNAPPPYPQSTPTDGWPNGPTIRHVTGTVYWEGAHIDMRCTCRDAIAIANVGHYENGGTLIGNQPLEKTPKITIVNSILENPLQCAGGVHGDIVHGQGTGTRPQVKLQNVVYRHGFQGLYLDVRDSPAGHGASRIELDHVQVYKRTEGYCIRIPQLSGSTGSIMWGAAPRDGVWFRNTWMVPGATTAPAQTGFDAQGLATYAASAGVRTTGWSRGTNPDGDPATPSMVGRNYKRSYFTGGTEPDPDPDPDPDPQDPEAGVNRIFTKNGHAQLGSVLSEKYLTGNASKQVVAYMYREHPKSATAGADDLCPDKGITWSGDVAQDLIYITSELSESADLDVKVGTAPAVRVSLPANQASGGQQSTVDVSNKVGSVVFTLSRNGAEIKKWTAKLNIKSAPAQRTVSTYSDAEIIQADSTQPRAWFDAEALDKQEGNTGTTEFTFSANRNINTEALTAKCTVQSTEASASDFDGGIMPVFDISMGAGGPLEKNYSFKVIGDTTQELDESFVVSCKDVKPLTYSAPSETKLSGVIRNDDAPSGASRFTIRVLDPTVLEGTGTSSTQQRFEITRLGDVTTKTDQVDFCPGGNESGVNSASANDFVGGWGTKILTFGPGETSKIEPKLVVQDSIAEPNETYEVVLRYPSEGATIENGTAKATIVNDDGLGASTGARVNAGQTSEAPYTDSNGNQWSADTGTGGAIDSNAFTFLGTTDQQIFQTYRYGPSEYTFNLEPGTYKVTGYFSEPDEANNTVDCELGSGRRLIHTTLTAKGGDVLHKSGIDPYCESGFRSAHIEALGIVNVSQNQLKLNVRSETGSVSTPLINGVVVEPYDVPPTSRRQHFINFGAEQGTTYSDGAGNQWLSAEPNTVTGCTSATLPSGTEIQNTSDDLLYRTICSGTDINISLPVDNSGGSQTKTVNMMFVEPTAGPAARTFDIYINGTKQFSDLDISQLAGGTLTALTRSVSPVSVQSNGRITARLVSTSTTPALISAMSITDTIADNSFSFRMGWRSKMKISKSDLIKKVSPTRLSASGNPIVIRKLNTTGSSVYACHGPCDGTATIGLQPDTQASNDKLYIEVMTHDPNDVNTSVFPSLAVGKSETDQFTVVAAELLPDGSTGAESTITVNITATRSR